MYHSCSSQYNKRYKLASVNSILMSSVIWNQLVFRRIATFYQFLLHAVATLLSKVFQRLLNYSFDTISDEKLQLFCSRSHRSEFQDISAVCLPFIRGNIFLPMADDKMMCSFVVSKVQKEQGIIFVVCSLEVSLRIICFRRQFGLPVWNFGRPRVNHRRLWQPCSC